MNPSLVFGRVMSKWRMLIEAERVSMSPKIDHSLSLDATGDLDLSFDPDLESWKEISCLPSPQKTFFVKVVHIKNNSQK